MPASAPPITSSSFKLHLQPSSSTDYTFTFELNPTQEAMFVRSLLDILTLEHVVSSLRLGQILVDGAVC